MSDASNPAQPDQNPPNQPQFDPEAAHQNKPKLRKIRGFPMPVNTPDGKQQVLLGIADAQQISTKMVATSPAFQTVLPMFDGSRDLDQIVAEVGRGLQRPMVEQLVAQLDDAGLIYGPTHDQLVAELRTRFDGADHLPAGSTADIADLLVQQEFGKDATDDQKSEHGPAKLREMLDKWIDAALKEVENPAFDTLPAAIVAPHLDYPRGWYNYAQVYGRMRVADRPDRVVVLGTNHFGESTGVCGCDKGFASPLGVCPVDEELVTTLRSKLGDEDAAKLFEHRFDHENEHSIELHLPWIQHVFGAPDGSEQPKIFAALVHDPVNNNGQSYDGNGLDLEPFIKGLKESLAQLGGTTLVVSSADLSHVGPAFGDQQTLAGEEEAAKAFRAKVASHDKEMLNMVVEKKMEDLVGSMAWQQNPTRWCSLGNMAAAVGVTDPDRVELLNYAAAMDPEGNTFVSSAAMAMFKG